MSVTKPVPRSDVRARWVLSLVSLLAGCSAEQANRLDEAAGASVSGGAGGGVPASGGVAGKQVSGESGTAGTGGPSASGGGTAGGSTPSVGGIEAGAGGVPFGTGGGAGTGGAGGGQGGTTNTAGESGQGAAGTAGAGSVPPKVTIWIAGDSTVKTYVEPNTSGNGGVSLYGWGQEIGQFLSSEVTINNQANGGRSVATFMWPAARDAAGNDQCIDDLGTPKFQTDASGNKVDSPMWANIKNGMRAGDYLLIQFGHNDETHTCGRYVSIPDYETYLGFMADTVVAKGVTPVFVTPMGHRTFTGTKFNNTLLPYANAMKEEAGKKKSEVEDLNLRSGEYYESVGDSFLASTIFDGGTTHFTQAGAVQMAKLIVGEIAKNKGPLAAYVK